MTKRALILANGQPPKKTFLKRLVKQSDMFVCADGGSNTAARLGVRPDLIIGDLDSIGRAALKKFEHVRARSIADQNSTDLEKAITWLVRRGYARIMVAGALGGRTDHLLGNLSALAKFSKVARVTFVDESAEVSYIGNERNIELPVGTTVSLLPLSACEGITTKGLKWELKNEMLELGFRESTSNVVKSSPVSIKVKKGDLLLFRLLVPRARKKNKPIARTRSSAKRR